MRSPHKRRYDPDNRIKAVFDLLVKNAVLERDDDSIIHSFAVFTQVDGFDGVTVTIRSA